MNVLYLTHLYLPTVGGVQRSVHNLARLMVSRGHGVTVACHGDETGLESRASNGADILRLRIPTPFSFHPSQLAARAWHDPLNIGTLVRLCRRRRVQIVHCHLINVDTRYALVLARLPGVRLVVTLRGGETEHWLAPHPVRREYVSRILARADHVTGVAAALLHQTAELDAGVSEKCSVIPNPVDLRALLDDVPEVSSMQDEVPYAVFVGRLEEMKDVATLIEGFHDAVRRDPGLHLELRIVGSGSLRSTLERAAAAGPARDRIRFLGTMDYGTTLAVMRDARLLVLPSTSSEGCPNVVLEAAALGTPAVVSDLPALTEIVVDGETGWVFPRGDTAALARVLLEAAETPDERDRVVGAARRRLESHHDPEAIASMYEDVYERVLNSPRISSS